MDGLKRIVMHIDMDSFFASVEIRDRPEYFGKPVVVCSRTYSIEKDKKPRGVVSAASYPARKFGIRSAMPVSEALKRCPETIFLPMRKELYQAVSANVFSIIGKHTAVVQKASIDEAYADPGEKASSYEDAIRIAEAIKREIAETERITCSVGIGPNRTIAKIASGIRKPDGLTVVRPPDVLDFLAPLPIEKLPGAGLKTQRLMKSLRIETIGDLARAESPLIYEKMGRSGLALKDMALGLDDAAVTETKDLKSVSRYHTFDKATHDPTLLLPGIDAAAEEVGRDLRKNRFFFRTVTISLIFSDYTTVSRSKSHAVLSGDPALIKRCAKDLFWELAENDDDRLFRERSGSRLKKIRRLSVGVSNLKKIGRDQMTFDDF